MSRERVALWPRGRPWRSLAVLALGIVVFGCSSASDDAGSATSTTGSRPQAPGTSSTTQTTAEPLADEVAEVEAAYEAASRAFIAAAAIPDPDDERVAATHTGPMLERSRTTLLGLQADGRVIRYPEPAAYRIEVTNIEIEGDVARLVACVVDDGERVVVATGEVVAGGIGTVEWRVAMQRIDGTWRLAERLENGRWEGVAGCAAD